MIDNSKQKATRGTSGILSEADAGTAFSSVIDTVLGKIWQVVENEEYVEVVTDADGTFLRGIKSGQKVCQLRYGKFVRRRESIIPNGFSCGVSRTRKEGSIR